MTSFSPLAIRHVIPRWRPLSATIRSYELAMPGNATKLLPRNPSAELIRRLEARRLQKSDTIAAAEVVETAIVEQLAEEAVLPARVLLLPGSGATNLVCDQARRLLMAVDKEYEDRRAPEHLDSVSSSIAFWRAATNLSPRDPLAWVELSLSYVTIGKDKSALRAMAVALQLAPHDRHVLRSAARLFLHRRDAEQAHDLLRDNSATRSDPWLMAGEIALSALAERSPSFFKAGINLMANGGMRPRHMSELASAIGTAHLKDGNRRARKLFDTSLVDPTGNSLAQAEWASSRLGGLLPPHILDRSEDSTEARVFEAYWKGHFRKVVDLCEIWRLEEPYSSRPNLVGSGSAIIIEEFETAICFCDEGLKENPEQAVLRNNRAYSLVAIGKYEEALHLITSALATGDGDVRAIAKATFGFLQMRVGNYERGVKLYREAISHFKTTNNVTECCAWAYFALEVARAELPDAHKILEDAKLSASPSNI